MRLISLFHTLNCQFKIEGTPVISNVDCANKDHFKFNYLDERSKLGVEKLSTNFLVVKIVPLHSFNDFGSLKLFEVFGKKFSRNTITQL